MSDNARHRNWIIPVVWGVRILVGLVFLFSGFVKSIDPWGTIYKAEEYVAALDITVSHPLIVGGVFLLCIVEFLIGVFLVTGCFRRITAISLALFMCVMLPLTAWVAFADPVQDCGCFGDVLRIGNWETFAKNVILSAAAVLLVTSNTKVGWLVRPSLQWICAIASGLYIGFLAFWGYNIQPMLDFRQLPVGTDVLALDSIEDDAEEFLYVYRKGDLIKEFTIDEELPDETEGWIFVERKSVGERENAEISFNLWSPETGEDVTSQVLSEDKKILAVLIPNLDEISAAFIWKINALEAWCDDHGVKMMSVVSGSPEQIDSWRDIALASYPIYSADDTQIKILARGNPALALFDNGVVIWKGSLSVVDDDRLAGNAKGVYSDISEFQMDYKRILKNISLIYLLVMAVVLFLSYYPAYLKIFDMKRKFIHDDKARRAK